MNEEAEYRRWQRQVYQTQLPISQLEAEDLETMHWLDRDNWPCRQPGCSGHTRWEHRMMEEYPPEIAA